jgi:hypothetical protein
MDKAPLTFVLVTLRVFEPAPKARLLELMAMIRPEPAPCTEIPFPAMVTPEAHVHVPAGMVTVSPSAAELMAACTSPVLQDAAALVLAFVCPADSIINRKTDISGFANLLIDDVPFIRARLAWLFPTLRLTRDSNKIHCTGVQSLDRTLPCSSWQDLPSVALATYAIPNSDPPIADFQRLFYINGGHANGLELEKTLTLDVPLA